MRKLLGMFLIISGCAQAKHIDFERGTKFDADWEMIESPDGTIMSCMPIEDIIELRRTLRQCQRN